MRKKLGHFSAIFSFDTLYLPIHTAICLYYLRVITLKFAQACATDIHDLRVILYISYLSEICQIILQQLP